MRRRLVLLSMCAVVALTCAGCANFRALSRDLLRMERSYFVSGLITNAEDFDGTVIAVAMEWNGEEVLDAAVAELGDLGMFAFTVEGGRRWYVASVADINRSGHYEVGEPAWLYADDEGRPVPIEFDRKERQARVSGRLSTDTVIPQDLLLAARAFAEVHPPQALRKRRIPIELAEEVFFECPESRAADGSCPRLTLDDPQFSEEAGRRGLWQPLTDPIHSGVGIYVIGEHDPDRIPVLFVYGAGGSAQNWRAFFEAFRDGPFQPWFFRYPTGRRLGEMAQWLLGGIRVLESHFGTERFFVVAHSQGGLVARSFLLRDLAAGHKTRIPTFVSISTPWAGHHMAQRGVDSPLASIPSWHDLAPGSDFLRDLFAKPLLGRIDHHLLFSFHGKSSWVQEQSNDGAVSVASQLRPEAQDDAVRLYGFDRTHNGILSDPEVIDLVRGILEGEGDGDGEGES